MISCSHCKVMRLSHLVVDSLCTHTICDECVQGGHNNTIHCKVCGIAPAKPCLHQFSTTVEGVCRCVQCGQIRAENPAKLKSLAEINEENIASYIKAKKALSSAAPGKKVVDSTVKCDHCGQEFYAPNGICLKCSKGGHSMFGPCSKCAAQAGKMADQKCAELGHILVANPDLTWCSRCGRILSAKGQGAADAYIKTNKGKPVGGARKCAHCGEKKPSNLFAHGGDTNIVTCLECQGKGHDLVGVCDECGAVGTVKCGHCGEIKSHMMLAPASTDEWPLCQECASAGHNGGNKCYKCADAEKNPILMMPINSMEEKPVNKKVQMEDVLCIHCMKKYKAEGDLKTCDLIYVTCIHCYQAGHRGLPRPLGHCDECAQWPGPLSDDLRRSSPDKDEKLGRNIIL